MRLEDYALIGDRGTAALVGIDGSIDWFCAPRFDSPALFAALLGDDTNGFWRIAPPEPVFVARRYRADTLVLETDLRGAGGTVRLVDFMPAERAPGPRIVRLVQGLEGTVDVHLRLAARFGYGDLAPWTRRIGDAWTMTATGAAAALRSDVPIERDGPDLHATCTLRAGDERWFELAWYPSYRDVPAPIDPRASARETEAWWREWAGGISYDGAHADAVRTSLFVLKALTYAPSGASVAAVTTSLPEVLGGAKNWDYRYAWVRDSTYTIAAFLNAGLLDEARAWRDWLLCAFAGEPQRLQIMYGVTGTRYLAEIEQPHLRGYEDSRPVRIGNAAATQFQLGIYGETMNAIYLAHRRGVEIDDAAWAMIGQMLAHVEDVWTQPDRGIWESRGEPRHYTHSKMQAWRAFDCAVRAIDEFGFAGPRERWAALRETIRADVMEHGFDRQLGAFTQAYGSRSLDASVLMGAIVGFVDARDPQMIGTVAALERTLVHDGWLARTQQDPETDAAHADAEGAFFACNLWLADVYTLQGRDDDARAIVERVLAVAGRTGLLSEEYDPRARRLVGNLPQTLSHASFVNSAVMSAARGTAARRRAAAPPSTHVQAR